MKSYQGMIAGLADTIQIGPSLVLRVGAADTLGRLASSDPQVARRPLLSAAVAVVLSVATNIKKEACATRRVKDERNQTKV
jgi:hypothetical protein